MEYVQQGDVILKKIEKLLENTKSIQGNLIHKGYSHSHTIQGDFELVESGNDFFVIAKNNCQVVHEEHKPIVLESGIYHKVIVSEYDHFLEESREVVD